MTTKLLPVKYRTADIVAQIDGALADHTPYVLNRAADGEASCLAEWAGYNLTTKLTKPFLADWYRIGLDNTDARTAIINNLGNCDALGIPTLEPWADMFNMTPGLIDAFRAWNYDLSQAPLTHHGIIRFMIIRGEFERWHGRRIVVLNEEAEPIAEGLKPKMNVVGAVTLGRDEIDEAVERVAAYDFEIALIGVGVRKFAIAPRLAERTGCVVIDCGYTLNILSDVHPAKMGRAQGTYQRDWAMSERIVRERGDEV